MHRSSTLVMDAGVFRSAVRSVAMVAEHVEPVTSFTEVVRFENVEGKTRISALTPQRHHRVELTKKHSGTFTMEGDEGNWFAAPAAFLLECVAQPVKGQIVIHTTVETKDKEMGYFWTAEVDVAGEQYTAPFMLDAKWPIEDPEIFFRDEEVITQEATGFNINYLDDVFKAARVWHGKLVDDERPLPIVVERLIAKGINRFSLRTPKGVLSMAVMPVLLEDPGEDDD